MQALEEQGYKGKKTVWNVRVMMYTKAYLKGKKPKEEKDTEYVEVDNNTYTLTMAIEALTNELRKIRHGR